MSMLKGKMVEHICNIIVKVRRDKISFTKNAACLQTGSIEIYALLSLVCGNIFIHYW